MGANASGYGSSVMTAFTYILFGIIICYSLYLATRSIKKPFVEKIGSFWRNFKNPNPLTKYTIRQSVDTIDYITTQNVVIRIYDIRRVSNEWNFLFDVCNFDTDKKFLQIHKVIVHWSNGSITWGESYDKLTNTMNSGSGYKKHIIMTTKLHNVPKTIDIFYMNEFKEEFKIVVELPSRMHIV